MTDGERIKAGEVVRQIRRLLGDWLETSQDAREPVVKVLRLLDALDELVQRDRSKRSVEGEPLGGRQTAATYTIEKKRNAEEVLVERRATGTSQPFRCPRYVYDGIVQVLTKAEEPLDFEQIMQGLTDFVPDPAEFLVRVVVWFLMSHEPPLVVRDRRSYRPARKAKFQTEAKAAWTALLKASKTTD